MWIEKGAGTAIEILCDFLCEFVTLFELNEIEFTTGDFDTNKLNNLTLFVGASFHASVDMLKEAFSILQNPSRTTCKEIEKSVETQEFIFFEKLINRTIIFNATTYLRSQEEDKEDKRYIKTSTFLTLQKIDRLL